MKKILFLLLSAVCLLASCSKSNPPEPDQNDYLISAEKTSTVPKALLQALLQAAGYGAYASLLQSDVDLVKVTYNTQYQGNTLTASGLFFVPADLNASYPTMILQHGTIAKSETPSLCADNPATYTEAILMSLIMSTAFRGAVLLPDYLGYGSSVSMRHPYIHGESLGRTSLDMIRAYQEYTAGKEINLAFNPRIVVTGYSEGGYAAVALHKAIQEATGSGLQVVKTIAGSGPYDNVAFAKETLALTGELDAAFIDSYLWGIAMYKESFNYSKPYSAIFSAADNAVLETAGYPLGYSETEALPISHNPSVLFHADFIAGVENGTDTELLGILADNSLVEFAPRDSLILLCGSADTYVPPVNTRNAYQAMAAKDCPVKMYEYPGLDHYTLVPQYLSVLLGRLQNL